MTSKTMPAGQPIACTLTADDFAQRADWIRALASNHLLSVTRSPLTLQLTYAPAAARQIKELVRKEQACCAFLTFDIQQSEKEIRLTVTAPDEAREAADLLFAHFAPDDAKPTATSGSADSRRPG
jgi:hypothetical protein